MYLGMKNASMLYINIYYLIFTSINHLNRLFTNKKPLKMVLPDCKAATKFEKIDWEQAWTQWLAKIQYDLEIWMDKVKVTKAATKFEIIHLEQT